MLFEHETSLEVQLDLLYNEFVTKQSELMAVLTPISSTSKTSEKKKNKRSPTTSRSEKKKNKNSNSSSSSSSNLQQRPSQASTVSSNNTSSFSTVGTRGTSTLTSEEEEESGGMGDEMESELEYSRRSSSQYDEDDENSLPPKMRDAFAVTTTTTSPPTDQIIHQPDHMKNDDGQVQNQTNKLSDPIPISSSELNNLGDGDGDEGVGGRNFGNQMIMSNFLHPLQSPSNSSYSRSMSGENGVGWLNGSCEEDHNMDQFMIANHFSSNITRYCEDNETSKIRTTTTVDHDRERTITHKSKIAQKDKKSSSSSSSKKKKKKKRRKEEDGSDH